MQSIYHLTFHMQACQPITAEAGYTQQTRPFKDSVHNRG